MEKRDFYKITDLTSEFRGQKFANLSDRDWIFVYQAQFQLAIAQQLAVISSHLGALVEMCENVKGKTA